MAGFMDRLGGLVFPTANYQGVDPALQKQLQDRAMLTMGLGMLAGQRKGFGAAAMGGMGAASDQYNEAMQTAYVNAKQTRAEETEAKRHAEKMDWEKTVFGAEEGRAARQEQATQAWREKQAELEQRRLEISAKTATSGMQDDTALAEYRRLQADELRTRQDLMSGLRDKVAKGIPLTEDEKVTWQMVMTGRPPTENPWEALLGGGGPQIQPDGKGAPVNRLAADPRL